MGMKVGSWSVEDDAWRKQSQGKSWQIRRLIHVDTQVTRSVDGGMLERGTVGPPQILAGNRDAWPPEGGASWDSRLGLQEGGTVISVRQYCMVRETPGPWNESCDGTGKERAVSGSEGEGLGVRVWSCPVRGWHSEHWQGQEETWLMEDRALQRAWQKHFRNQEGTGAGSEKVDKKVGSKPWGTRNDLGVLGFLWDQREQELGSWWPLDRWQWGICRHLREGRVRFSRSVLGLPRKGTVASGRWALFGLIYHLSFLLIYRKKMETTLSVHTEQWSHRAFLPAPIKAAHCQVNLFKTNFIMSFSYVDFTNRLHLDYVPCSFTWYLRLSLKCLFTTFCFSLFRSFIYYLFF